MRNTDDPESPPEQARGDGVSNDDPAAPAGAESGVLASAPAERPRGKGLAKLFGAKKAAAGKASSGKAAPLKSAMSAPSIQTDGAPPGAAADVPDPGYAPVSDISDLPTGPDRAAVAESLAATLAEFDAELARSSTSTQTRAEAGDGLLSGAINPAAKSDTDLLDPETLRLMDAELRAAFYDRRKAEDVQDAPPGDAAAETESAEADPAAPIHERRGAASDWNLRPSRGTSDDPLLGCLTVLCALLDRPITADALTAGLPLDQGHLTPDLFVRAASRAGISARLVTRALTDISTIALPCVILLRNRRAAVLTQIKDRRTAVIVLPEMGAGAREVAVEELAADYAGHALFARPEFQFDDRAEDVQIKDPKGWFWGALTGSWKLYIEVMIAATLINLFAIAGPLFTMNVYDRVVPNFAEETLWVLAAGVVIVYGFDFILKLLRAYLVDIAGKSADTKIAARLFQQTLGMKMAHRPPSAGALANQLREFESIREFFTSSTLTALIDLPFIFMFIAIIYVIGGPVAIIPAAVVFIVIPVGMLMQIPMKKLVQETFREAQQKHAILVEAISGIETIKATASEGRMQRNWETFVGRTAKSAMKAGRWSQIALNFSGWSMQMVTILVIIYGVYLIQAGQLTVGALIACTILSGRALAPLGQIAAIATRFHQARNSLTALDQMMQTPVERPEGRSFVHRQSFSGHIEFKNVSFSYPEADTKALTDVSFTIQAGDRVGIIGRIGSGKSTIERLIMGLYDPTEGAVLADGTDTRQVDPADLRRSIGVVPQDVYLFFGTVKENIALGAPYADDAMILRAARISGVDEFTARHPLGLDMPVGERGASLSGGQRQAISIARALLLDPPILIMDEPTSAMDNTTEGRFKQRLQSILPNKTLILVTHRGSLLSLVDRLVVMDGGRMVADGPKDEVMAALASGRIQTAKT